MTCPNWNCRERIDDSYDGTDCPACRCYLFPVRPHDQRENAPYPEGSEWFGIAVVGTGLRAVVG